MPFLGLIRLGQRKEEAVRSRPIKIILPNSDLKFKILKSSRELKHYTKHQRIGLSSDKTKKQRLQDQVHRTQIQNIKNADPNADPVIFRGRVMERAQMKNIREREEATFVKGSGSAQGGTPVSQGAGSRV